MAHSQLMRRGQRGPGLPNYSYPGPIDEDLAIAHNHSHDYARRGDLVRFQRHPNPRLKPTRGGMSYTPTYDNSITRRSPSSFPPRGIQALGPWVGGSSHSHHPQTCTPYHSCTHCTQGGRRGSTGSCLHPHPSHFAPQDFEHFDSCSCSTPATLSNPNGNSKKEFDFKTKDLVVRGKGFAVRSSYLNENSKFEDNLTKYMDKKKSSEVSDKILEMLISFINRETYENKDIVDEVILNILASNVGVKSVVSASLERLKEWGRVTDDDDVGQVVVLTMCSGKVEEGLRGWLKEWLGEGRRWERWVDRGYGRAYWGVYDLHPEAVVGVEVLLGYRSREVRDPYRVL